MVRPVNITLSISEVMDALMAPQGLTRLQRTLDVNRLESQLLQGISYERRCTNPPLARQYDEVGFCVGLEPLDGIEVPRLPPLSAQWVRKQDLRKHMLLIQTMMQCNQIHYILQQDHGMRVAPPYLVLCSRKTGLPRRIMGNKEAYILDDEDDDLQLCGIKSSYLEMLRESKEPNTGSR
jgi:hypothetical protein